MAPRLRSASVLHNVLPEEALRVIMLALPVDARARAACVCRSWRAFLADTSLWQVLDLTPAGSVVRVTGNLLRGAVARAAGGLRSLSYNCLRTPSLAALVESDGAELQQVNTNRSLSVQELRAVLAAAPRLQALNAGVSGRCAELLPILRNDPPYGPLRATQLRVLAGREDAADVLALAAAVAAHESLKELNLEGIHSAPGLNALVDAAAVRRVTGLQITECDLDAESVAALARLLQRGSLTKLCVACVGFPHSQEESWPVLCAALRECRTLTHLDVDVNPFNGATRRTVADLLDAAAAMPALSELDLNSSSLSDKAAFGHAFGALLAADPPSLHTLNVNQCRLGDEGLAPLLDGLAASTHLRTLQCQEGNDLSEAFERDRLEPALAALAARAALDA
jgi:hypothetical protein